MGKLQHWLSSFRPRTLTLAFSGIFVGSMLAFRDGFFQFSIFILSLLTALSLQILSNLANDFGDFDKGTDNDERKGPKRALQRGVISKKEMKNMILFFVVLSLLLGLVLLYVSFKGTHFTYTLLFFFIGIASILAALKYTIGNNAYGYFGLGDLFVFIFFGIVAVGGSYFLFSHQISLLILLPASALGLLNAGVLNINNMRDEESDRKTHKKTVVVLIGNKYAKIYHAILLIGSILLFGTYSFITFHNYFDFLFLFPSILLIRNLYAVYHKNPNELDNELKFLAISTFFVSLFFGFGIII